MQVYCTCRATTLFSLNSFFICIIKGNITPIRGFLTINSGRVTRGNDPFCSVRGKGMFLFSFLNGFIPTQGNIIVYGNCAQRPMFLDYLRGQLRNRFTITIRNIAIRFTQRPFGRYFSPHQGLLCWACVHQWRTHMHLLLFYGNHSRTSFLWVHIDFPFRGWYTFNNYPTYRHDQCDHRNYRTVP